jgi:hypothetical protein
MNKVYLITYDLKSPSRDYTSLKEAIKRSPNWWHHIGTTWLIKTSETPSQIWSRLAQHVAKTDNVLIIEVTKQYSGWLPQKAWNWINKHLSSP